MTRQYTIRAVRAHEWREVRDLRLDALSDEAAGTAFRESHREAAARPDRFWQDRGRGVADDLLRAVTDWLRELGVGRVRLHVHADDVRARRAYERSGFRPTGTRRTGTIGPELEVARAL